MTKLLVSKKAGKPVQEIGLGGDDCNAGMLMTPIYMNVEKDRSKDVISLGFRDSGAGYTQDYAFSRKAEKYRKSK
jgi:hypothetical protein